MWSIVEVCPLFLFSRPLVPSPLGFHQMDSTIYNLERQGVDQLRASSRTCKPCASVCLRWKREQVAPRCSDAGPVTRGGEIQRRVLSNEGRQKLNSASDREFYSFPRFVKHVDDAFLASLTQLYRERVPEGAEVLDLMSSWVSHLPPERRFKRVVGHGLNGAELARNPSLDHFFINDLNQAQELAAADGSFDAVLCAVSVQYLQQPEKVFAEIYRVLRPGGVCVVSFSNRMFYDKAVAAWREGSAYSRVQLVVQYFQCVAGFTQAEVVRKLPQPLSDENEGWLAGLRRFLQGVAAGRDPFYTVVAYRNFKPM